MTLDRRTVGIVGLGLVGGSLARALAPRCAVVASTRSYEARTAAQALGIAVVDRVEDLVERAEVIVLATPLAVLPGTLASVGSALPAAGAPTVTDVGSVKLPLVEAAGALPAPEVFVPGHPMAGNQGAGWAATDADLFRGSSWALVVDGPVDVDRWRDVAELALGVGARVVPVRAGQHDRSVAVASHVPHLLAAVLARLLEGEPPITRTLAAGSFASATRVVSGPGAGLGAEMALANADPVVEAAGALCDDLEMLLGELSTPPDPDAVRSVFASAAALLTPRGWQPVDGPLTRDALLELGDRGGRVLAIEGGTFRAEVPVP